MTNVAVPLSLERIVDEAIAILDEEGAAAFSRRRLATRLGVSTMSTYHHAADESTLVEAVAERIMAELEIPDADDDWPDAVRTLAWSFRRITLAHPEAFKVLLAGARPMALLRTAETVQSLLEHRGFDSATALMVFRTVLRYLIGSAVADQGGVAGTGVLDGSKGDAQFGFGLEAIIAGVLSGQPT